jgi:hypothetical protein
LFSKFVVALTLSLTAVLESVISRHVG